MLNQCRKGFIGTGPGPHRMLAVQFTHGTLMITETGNKKGTAVHAVADEAVNRNHDLGGIHLITCSLAIFEQAMDSENRIFKRTRTAPSRLSVIESLHSDEILHRARFSLMKRTNKE